jgi:LysM repeat protein
MRLEVIVMKNEKSMNQTKAYTILVSWIWLSLALVGCGLLGSESEETPSPTWTKESIVVAVTNTPDEGLATPTFTPESTTAIPQPTTAVATDTPVVATDTPVPATTAAPTCGPPANWVPYQVQPGDTLFRLALNTGTTVEAIMQANCLTSATVIFAGQNLFLPKLPPSPTPPPPTASPTMTPTPTATTVTPEEPPECAGDFCPNPDLAGTLTLDPGGPNNAAFTPCQVVTQPRLEFDSTIKEVELGQRRYIYVCVPDPVSAFLARADGQTQSVNLLSTLPNPDLQTGDAQAFIDWPALPFEPTGPYTMTVMRSDSTPVNFLFFVIPPSTERILVVPQARQRGAVFQVYYVNFNLNSTATIDLYGEDDPVVGGFHEMSLLNSHPVTINQPLAGSSGKGWAQESLVSHANNMPAAYSLTFDNRRIFDLFWLR